MDARICKWEKVKEEKKGREEIGEGRGRKTRMNSVGAHNTLGTSKWSNHSVVTRYGSRRGENTSTRVQRYD